MGSYTFNNSYRNLGKDVEEEGENREYGSNALSSKPTNQSIRTKDLGDVCPYRRCDKTKERKILRGKFGFGADALQNEFDYIN